MGDPKCSPRRRSPIAMQQCDAMKAESWFWCAGSSITLIGGLAIAWRLSSYDAGIQMVKPLVDFPFADWKKLL